MLAARARTDGLPTRPGAARSVDVTDWQQIEDLVTSAGHGGGVGHDDRTAVLLGELIPYVVRAFLFSLSQPAWEFAAAAILIAIKAQMAEDAATRARPGCLCPDAGTCWKVDACTPEAVADTIRGKLRHPTDV